MQPTASPKVALQPAHDSHEDQTGADASAAARSGADTDGKSQQLPDGHAAETQMGAQPGAAQENASAGAKGAHHAEDPAETAPVPAGGDEDAGTPTASAPSAASTPKTPAQAQGGSGTPSQQAAAVTAAVMKPAPPTPVQPFTQTRQSHLNGGLPEEGANSEPSFLLASTVIVDLQVMQGCGLCSQDAACSMRLSALADLDSLVDNPDHCSQGWTAPAKFM